MARPRGRASGRGSPRRAAEGMGRRRRRRRGGGGGGGSCVIARIVPVHAHCVAATWGPAAPCARLDACRPRSCSWKHLYDEVVTSGLCTGCAGCVIACPHDVLGYRDDEGVYKPFQLEEGYGARRLQPRREGLHLLHPGLPPLPGLGARGRRVPVRPGPRPPRSCRASTRTSSSPAPPTRCSTRSARTAGSCRRSSCTRSRRTSSTPRSCSYLEGDGTTWKAVPGVARTKEEIIASAGSRYTYSAEHDGLRRGHRGRRRAHRARRA